MKKCLTVRMIAAKRQQQLGTGYHAKYKLMLKKRGSDRKGQCDNYKVLKVTFEHEKLLAELSLKSYFGLVLGTMLCLFGANAVQRGSKQSAYLTTLVAPSAPFFDKLATE